MEPVRGGCPLLITCAQRMGRRACRPVAGRPGGGRGGRPRGLVTAVRVVGARLCRRSTASERSPVPGRRRHLVARTGDRYPMTPRPPPGSGFTERHPRRTQPGETAGQRDDGDGGTVARIRLIAGSDMAITECVARAMHPTAPGAAGGHRDPEPRVSTAPAGGRDRRSDGGGAAPRPPGEWPARRLPRAGGVAADPCDTGGFRATVPRARPSRPSHRSPCGTAVRSGR